MKFMLNWLGSQPERGDLPVYSVEGSTLYVFNVSVGG